MNSSYAISKTAAEDHLAISGQQFVTFRLADVIGPRNVSGPLPIFYQRLTEGKRCFVTKARRDFVFIAALGLYFSTVHAFLRDFGVALPNVLMLVLFMTPTFYPLESVPRILQPLTVFNPVYIIVESLRLPLVYDQPPDPWLLTFLAVIACTLFVTGLRFFRRRKGLFGAML